MFRFDRTAQLTIGLIFSFFVPAIGMSQTVSDTIAPPQDLTLPFSSVAIGKQSSAETITLSNLSTKNSLKISQIQLSGPDSTAFFLNLNGGSSPCGSSSPTLPIAESCTVTVSFIPNGEGLRNAFLNLSLGPPMIAFHDTVTKGIRLYNLSTKVTTDLTSPGINMEDSDPSWSPDGSQLVFSRHQGDPLSGTLFTANVDGTANPMLLADIGSNNMSTPAWSPDGQKIVFRHNAFGELRFFDFNLGAVSDQVIGNQGTQGAPRKPSWSSDGNRLVFHRENTIAFKNEIVLVALTFDSLTGAFSSSAELSVLSEPGKTPAWSPDGRKIAFQNNISKGIDSVDPGGNALRPITNPPPSAEDKNPSWSPDSSQLVFHRSDGLDDKIIIINADGTGEQPSISTTGLTPAWSPDLPRLSLSGTGLAAGKNSPPSSPQLVSPEDRQTDLGTSVTLRWLPASDPEGDAVNYQYTVCETPRVLACMPVSVQLAKSEQKKGFILAGIGSLFFGIAFIPMAGKKKSIRSLVGLIIVSQFLLAGCGSGGGGGGGNSVDNTGGENQILTQVVSGLKADTTYFWQITATDFLGSSTKSEVRQFKT